MKLISQSLARVLTLHGQYVLECLLLAAKDLYLFFVLIEVLVERAARLSEVAQLALKVCRVVISLHLADCGLCCNKSSVN